MDIMNIKMISNQYDPNLIYVPSSKRPELGCTPSTIHYQEGTTRDTRYNSIRRVWRIL